MGLLKRKGEKAPPLPHRKGAAPATEAGGKEKLLSASQLINCKNAECVQNLFALKTYFEVYASHPVLATLHALPAHH